MRVVGIVCEYNPFHRGHAWQLAEVRRRLGEDTAVVCAMSGNFVQRGEMAVVRKHVRAEAAVRGGADLVLEIPLPWAISSAEGFARGGVGVLRGTGLIDTLAFGSECADTEKLQRAAQTLESDAFQTAVRSMLDKGKPFAEIRQEAAAQTLGEEGASVLASPNDILGVEYCRALLRAHSAIAPMALPRSGAAHDAPGSASEIRARLRAGADDGGAMTEEMARLYAAEAAAGRAPVRTETAERAILSRLRALEEEDFAACDGGGEGLYHRVYEAVRAGRSVEEVLSAAKTKRYAHARLRRLLLAAYLGVRPEDAAGEPPYLRVLALNDKGKALLGRMRKTALVPVLTRPAAVRKLDASSRRIFELESRATDQYVLAYPSLAAACCGSEWTEGPVIVDGGKV